MILPLFTGTAAAADAQVRYTNPDSGFQVVIIDELDLLTDRQEAWLVEDMKPITQFGNIAFWTTDEDTSDEIDQARLKRLELFEYSSAGIFVINMNVRKLTIQSYGKIYESISDSKARSITDNVSKYATSGQYYGAASKAYDQMFRVLDGLRIPEPMKITGYAIISLMIGVTAALSLAFSKRLNPIREVPLDYRAIQIKGAPPEKGARVEVPESEVRPRSGGGSVFGGSGCSSCSGGGCSSCGGCGGGGSSSF